MLELLVSSLPERLPPRVVLKIMHGPAAAICLDGWRYARNCSGRDIDREIVS